MKYTVIKRIHFQYSDDSVNVIKEADTFEEATKFKVAAQMLQDKNSEHTIEILINSDDAFEFTREPLLLKAEVSKKAS